MHPSFNNKIFPFVLYLHQFPLYGDSLQNEDWCARRNETIHFFLLVNAVALLIAVWNERCAMSREENISQSSLPLSTWGFGVLISFNDKILFRFSLQACCRTKTSLWNQKKIIDAGYNMKKKELIKCLKHDDANKQWY